MSTFKSALALCGMTQSAAADFFDVRIDTVKSWSAGRNSPPEGVWLMLAARMRDILDAADYGADHMNLEGIDPRAYSNIAVSLPDQSALDPPAENIAGALALLMAIDDGD